MDKTIGERLKRLRKERGLTQTQLAQLARIGQSAIGNLESDIRGYGASILAIAAALGVSPAYLQLETNDPRPAATSTVEPNVSPAPFGSNRIPLIDYVRAGLWAEVADPYAPGDASEFLLTDLDLSGNAFALEIKGDSMLPEFRPGDRIIIDPAITPQPGDFVVAKNGEDEATFKKYRPRGANERGDIVFELVPLNEDYPSMRSDVAPIRIVGTMVEHRKYRRRG